MTFVKRQDKVMFLESVEETFNRMKGFTSITTNKNATEYNRQYVDEAFETTDVVAISTSIDWEFDQKADDATHEKLVTIIDNELIGDDAVIGLLQVDMTQTGVGEGSFVATKRPFTVIPGSEGGNINAYTYGGTFKVKGEKIVGEATSTDGWKTCKFVANEAVNEVEGE